MVGQRRGPGKAAALAAAEQLMAGGARLQLLSEDMFIDLLRAHAGAATQPVQAASPLAELVAALPSVTDAGRIKRALDMLKRERMQLFTEVADDHVAGIVRSQTGYSEYSTRLHADGRYSCCEPSLAWCMGMGGGVCVCKRISTRSELELALNVVSIEIREPGSHHNCRFRSFASDLECAKGILKWPGGFLR